MYKNDIKKELENKKNLQKLLYKRGYLFTSKNIKNLDEYPFYNNWKKININNYFLYVHLDQKFYIEKYNDIFFILIGHAYNPWDKIADEREILNNLVKENVNSSSSFFEKLNEITGVFTILKLENDNIYAVQDAVGLMPVYYKEINHSNKELWLSSHSQLIADLCHLEMDKPIYDLVNSKFYLIGIRHLPGIKSPFKKVKSLTANTYLVHKNYERQDVIRFFPNSSTCNSKTSEENVQIISKVLKNSMKIISKKYNAHVSLTGGTDSRMTLAASNEMEEKFKYFSFYSTEAEKKDVVAAQKIAKKLNLDYEVFKVPENNNELENFEIMKMLIEHNSGYIKKHTDAEIRKISYLLKEAQIKIEVKSHVSEIGRGFYYEKHGLNKMPKKLEPRHMSNFYKRNMFNRKVLKYMDSSFAEFINVTNFGDKFSKKYDESDMFYWEHRMSQWASFVNQDFDISHETTVIYNNRKLLDLFLDFELEDRISDAPQSKIVKNLNNKLNKLNIRNENAMNNKTRILIERIFFELNSLL